MSQQGTRIEVRESEDELISKAQGAVSSCNWVVGECAAKWTQKYSQGRTDADFAVMVGLSVDQVYQRRRVWEIFGDVFSTYPSLKWSHFYVSLSWDDASECLQWAEENQTTVAEMRAWRRALRGEDLTVEASQDEWGGDPTIRYVPTESTEVREPAPFESAGGGARTGRGMSVEAEVHGPGALAGVARESAGDGYAPFRKGAGGPAPAESSADVAVIENPKPSAEQLAKRMTMTLERMNKALSPEIVNEMSNLPDRIRSRLVKAVGQLNTNIARLM